jgi:hypothetical protein
MSDDNVLPFPLPPVVQAILKAVEFLPSPADPELTLWDDVVRMRLGSYTPGLPGSPSARLNTVEEAIDAANKIVTARRAFFVPR